MAELPPESPAVPPPPDSLPERSTPPDPAEGLLQRGGSLGRYLVITLLGRGGMGDVYSAYDPGLDRRVALKLLRVSADGPGARERLLREARGLAKLSHPNVVQIYEVGEHEGDVYLVMELIEGETLDVYCKATSKPGWQNVLAAYTDAARGLAAAHANGLVHRDVKPSNILRGHDGRARVADFGLVAGSIHQLSPSLAITLVEEPVQPLGETRPASMSGDMTVEGSVVGTPLYMAPEQHHSSRVTPASDQYSLCASLYEGLYGVSPFPVDDRGPKSASLLERKLAGVGPAPAGAFVPGWLHKIVVRGLSPNPADRYPSMTELVAALSKDPAAGRWGAKLAIGLIATALVVGSALRQIQLGRQLCSGGEQKLIGVWSPPLEAKAKAAFLATGLPYAEHAWSSVESMLATYGQAWVADYTDTCKATRVRGEQSDDVLDLRMTCLAQRLQELKASVDLFSAADAQVVEKSVRMASGLSPLTGCDDVEALKAPLRPPKDAATRAKVEDVRGSLARARALGAGGKYPEGIGEAAHAVIGANAIAYEPLRAEAQSQLGELQMLARQDALAETTLKEAFFRADACRDDALAAHVAVELAQHEGVNLETPSLGYLWARIAEAGLARSSANAYAQAELNQTRGVLLTGERKFDEALLNLREALAKWEESVGADRPQAGNTRSDIGVALWRKGKYDEALAELHRALALQEKALGPEHPDVAAIHAQIGGVLSEWGQNPQALDELRLALAIDEKALGPDHPRVAKMHNDIGKALWRKGQVEESLEEYHRALSLTETALGADHPEVATVRSNIGVILWHTGRYAEAIEQLRQALAIRVKAMGPDHPATAEIHNNLGLVFTEEGHFDEALAEFRLSLAIDERTLGTMHPEVARGHSNIGSVLVTQKKYAEGLVELQEALAIQENTLGADHPSTAITLGNIGEIDRTRQAWPEAIEHLSRAIAVLEAKRPDRLLLGEFRFELAEARWEANQTRAEALALAHQARDDYATLTARQKEVAVIDQWLAKHPAP